MVTIIKTRQELEALCAPEARRGLLRVELAVPGYPREVRRLQHQINRSLRTRGWGMSMMFLGVGLLLLVLWLLTAPSPAEMLSGWVLGSIGTALFALVVAGKLIGLLRAERRLRAVIAGYVTSSQ